MALRVMTYNVRYFAHAAPIRGMGSTKAGMAQITAGLARLAPLPHVIGLQEVEARSMRSKFSHTKGHKTETQIEAFMKGLEQALLQVDQPHRYRAHYFPAHVYQIGPAKLYTTGLAILVRSDLNARRLADAPHDITDRPDGKLGRRLKQSRVCAHVIVQGSDGHDYDVFNTHLSLPNVITRAPHRAPRRMGHGKNQAKEIQALANYVADHRRSDRYVVMGDFNSLPGSPAYDLLTDVLGVHDPFPEVLGMSVDDVRDRFPTAGFLRYRMRLDHIFAGPGLRWLDFEDTHPFGVKDGRWHGLSDHVPLVGRFQVRT